VQGREPVKREVDAMHDEATKLSEEQALSRLLSALSKYWPSLSFQVRVGGSLDREFGWVFVLDVDEIDVRLPTVPDTGIPRLGLVDRRTGQTAGTSRPYTPELLALYWEMLQASSWNAQNWCRTLGGHAPPRDRDAIRERTRALGLWKLAPARYLERSTDPIE